MAPRTAQSPTIPRALVDFWRDARRRHGRAASARLLARALWDFLRDSTPERRRRRFGDMEFDWEHPVSTTAGALSWRTRLLGLLSSPYQPTEPALFREMLAALPINHREFVFVDLGSGKGRALLLAADFPFRRIIGVELLPELHAVAQENIRRYRSDSQRCFDLSSLRTDARDFEFPAEPMVLYLFNPLPESALAEVVARLERSLAPHPRPVFVLYHNPLLEHVLARSPALKRIGGTHQYVLYTNA